MIKKFYSKKSIRDFLKPAINKILAVILLLLALILGFITFVACSPGPGFDTGCPPIEGNIFIEIFVRAITYSVYALYFPLMVVTYIVYDAPGPQTSLFIKLMIPYTYILSCIIVFLIEKIIKKLKSDGCKLNIAKNTTLVVTGYL